MKTHLGLAASVLLCVVAPGRAALAFPIAAPGTECLPVIVGGSDPIIATYQGNSAAFSNNLYLMLDASGQPGDDGNPANDLFIFNNHTSPVGSTADLGSFPIGTELFFRLHVNNTGNDFYSGPASQNPDGHCHARAQANWMPGETLVSFEDLLGGPFGYNDLSFSFTNTTTSSITLAPPVATNAAGTAHMVMAAIHDANGAPQAGAVVVFSIISGPNTGGAGTCTVNADCTTGANGEVSFSYTSNGTVGTDQIVACFTDTRGQHCSQPVIKIWTGCGPDGTPCDDGNLCTVGDVCSGGLCQGTPVDANDNNPCTDDSCDPGTGQAQHIPNTAPCSDSNLCTVGDLCSGGSCQPGTPVDANDNNPCTDDSCDPATGQVQHIPNTAPCTDGNLCTVGDVCSGGLCQGTPVDANDNNPCTDDICDPATGQAQHIPNTNPCDDDNLCTTGDVCSGGQCRGKGPGCDDGNACTTDACDPVTGCSHIAIDCNDHNKCTNDRCNPASGCVNASVDCDDHNACTTDACDSASGCTRTAVDCDDHNACTTDACDPVSGCTHTPATGSCDDGNACTDDGCDATSGACMHTPNTASCDDHNACTTGDVCSGGSCQGSGTLGCNDNDECTVDDCDPASGCTHTPRADCGGGVCTVIDGNVISAGTLSSTVDANGDVTVIFTESTDINDNSYGTNAVSWPRDHKLRDLAGSDKAQFVFKDANGNVVFDFFLDYISTKPGTPSGYASLGVGGDERHVSSGQASWLLDWSTSLDTNLNDTGYCTGGSCTVNGTNLLVDSPPTDPPNTSYNVSSQFSQWVFPIVYMVKVSHLAFGFAGFGGVSVPSVHNSPPKVGSNATAIGPCPCPDCDDGDPCTIDTCVTGGDDHHDDHADDHGDDHGDDHADNPPGDQRGGQSSRGGQGGGRSGNLEDHQGDAADDHQDDHADDHHDDHADDHRDDGGTPHCVHTPNPTCGQLAGPPDGRGSQTHKSETDSRMPQSPRTGSSRGR